ncbi:MAG: delta-class carbonic anhydrase [Pseudomonadota bacterium]
MNNKNSCRVAGAALASLAVMLSGCVEETAETTVAQAEGGICEGFGPQTPRDISKTAGANPKLFAFAPESEAMNLCNIHGHVNAEHKGPGFSIFAGATDDGGYACNLSTDLTAAERAPFTGEASFAGLVPGDSFEVHWVYTTCDVTPGEGLGSCLSDTCTSPSLRVESQVFQVVNDAGALDFADFAYAGTQRAGLHQPRALPDGTGDPVVFLGSTTGPKYTEAVCSPLEVTWSVRPDCAKLDIASVHRWAREGNVFNETKAHGVRQLVTAPALLARIE